MKARILFPRLDCSFKRGPVPSVVGPPNNPVRNYYIDFLSKLQSTYASHGWELEVVLKPLWQFTEEDCAGADIVYVPHRHRYQFDVPNALYYMQMGFPWLFSIDKKGWCAFDSKYPIQPDPLKDHSNVFNTLKHNIIGNNKSKFRQPNTNVDTELPEEYILFTCQLPHDSVIQEQSDTTVESALISTLAIGKMLDLPVVCKGHPINPGAMLPLKNLFNAYCKSEDVWLDSLSIHTCLARCEAMFTVNSGGTGLEAILHEKPIFIYGKADYQSVAFQINQRFDREMWRERHQHIDRYPSFIHAYINSHHIVNPDL